MKKTLLTFAACAMIAGTADAALYLIGQPGGQEWSPTIGTPMEEVDGGWKWSGFVAETDYFAFATQLMDTPDWDTFNVNYRLSPDYDGVEAAEGEYSMHFGAPDAAFKGTGAEVTLFVTVSDGNYTLTVSEKKLPPLYIVGQVDGNSWDPQTGVKMENTEGGWKWTGYVGEKDYFAFATKLMEPDPADPDANLWTEFNENYRLSPLIEEANEEGNIEAKAGEYGLRFGMPEGAFFGNNTTVTYFVSEDNGVYKLAVTESGDAPQPTKEKWGVVGAFNDWGNSGDPDFEMTEIRDGVWKATMYDFSGEFKFRANSKWDSNYGSATDDGEIKDYGEYQIALNGGNFNISDAMEAVSFVLDLNNLTLTVSEPRQDVWGVVGEFNDWGNSDIPDFQMTEIRNGVWKATMYDFSGEFKFRANNEWELNCGAYDSGVIDTDGVYTIGYDGANFNISEEVEEVVFELNLNDQTLTVSGVASDADSLMLTGSFNDWGFDSAYSFQEVDDDVYMLELDKVNADWKFKISNEGWKEYYTTGVADMTAGEPYPLGDRDGANMGLDNTYSEVTIILNLADEYFFFTGEVDDSVAATEIASGKARYFNMQGCEVTNPSDGIFIRVINGKSEKITVR